MDEHFGGHTLHPDDPGCTGEQEGASQEIESAFCILLVPCAEGKRLILQCKSLYTWS